MAAWVALHASVALAAVQMLLVAEAAWLLLRRRAVLPRFIFTVVSGIFLIDALDSALKQMPAWMWQLPLFLAGVSHVADLGVRLASADDRAPGTSPQ